MSRVNSIDLLALAFSHHRQAEKETCLVERRQLYRVANVYAVLASLDSPIAFFPRQEERVTVSADPTNPFAEGDMS